MCQMVSVCLQRIGDSGIVLQLSLNGVKAVVVHSAQDSRGSQIISPDNIQELRGSD